MPNTATSSCYNCGFTDFEERTILNEINGARACQSCASVLLFQSDYDRCYYPRNIRVRTEEQGYIPQTQIDNPELYTECNSCSKGFHTSNLTIVFDGQGSEQLICGDCINENNYVECNGCSTSMDTAFSVLINAGEETIVRCYNCADEISGTCQECSERTINTYDAEWRCTGCIPESSSVRIHQYNYRPTLKFNGDRSAGKYNKNLPTFLGIELEVDADFDEADDAANECRLLHNEDYIYLKEDSTTNGFEIVTHPSTFAYHKQSKWRDILKELNENDLSSYDGNRCGIHVHVTKNAFSPIVWWKVIEFSWKCKSLIKMFAQRNGNYEYCRYREPHLYGTLSCDRFPCAPSRYSHINTTHETVEFRMFRGTTDIERFWSTIEFVHALLEFCRTHGYSFIKRSEKQALWDEFCKHLKQQNYCITLFKHLNRRNLINRSICV